MTIMRSRRAVLSLGVLFVSPPFAAAFAKPEGAHSSTSLAGQLLVAEPEMSDPRFAKSVILMVQHDQKGALGIVINRPADEVPVAKLLDALGIDSKDSDGRVRLFAGGPVQPEVGFIVHTAEYRRT
jgi:putative transcriptional regulator